MVRSLVVSALLLCAALPAQAFGPHDNECVECHGVHTAKGKALIGVEPLDADNPSTGTIVGDISALCLGCHSEQGGILEINLMATHPIGIIPKKALVPEENLSRDGTLTCTSCHDPHPSNANYMYLRAEVSGGGDMGAFCALCHSEKREP